jgi:hypothetical protein
MRREDTVIREGSWVYAGYGRPLCCAIRDSVSPSPMNTTSTRPHSGTLSANASRAKRSRPKLSELSSAEVQ